MTDPDVRFNQMTVALNERDFRLPPQRVELGRLIAINDSHYDRNRPQPPPHLICVNCNNIIDGEMSLDQESLWKLGQVSDYKILRPQISLYGLCPECKKEI
jgi:Fe2+ or Zn2+ uptake regulation protein